MKKIILISAILTALLIIGSSVSNAGTLINHSTGVQLSTTCIAYDANNECTKLELTNGERTKIVEGYGLVPYGYRGLDVPEIFNYTATVPFAVGLLTESILIMIITTPITVPVGLAIDIVRSPVTITKKIIDQRRIRLIGYLFETEKNRTKTISNKRFAGVARALNMDY